MIAIKWIFIPRHTKSGGVLCYVPSEPFECPSVRQRFVGVL